MIVTTDMHKASEPPLRLPAPPRSTVGAHHDPRHTSQQTTMTMTQTTPEEYDALPSSIQKKYFSSVERLRIAQQAAAQKRKKQHYPIQDQPWPSSKQSLDAARPKTSHSIRTTSSFSFSKKRRALHTDVDEEQALRFLALPDKVKRSQFTPEELVLLTDSSERALGVSLSDGYRYSAHSTLDRNASLSSSYYLSSASDDLSDDMERQWMDSETVSTIEKEQEVDECDVVELYLSKRQDSLCSDYSRTAPSTSSSARAESRHRSFSLKRAKTLAPIPLPPLKLLPSVPALPSPVQLQNMESARSLKLAMTASETTSPTQYFKDSQARNKIREYLAPEKFEELLEFGFERGASSKTSDSESTSSPVSARAPSVFSDSYDSSATSYSSVQSSGAWSSAGKSVVRNLSPDLGGREMTLRMTLTRPELRAPEDELYAFQRKQVSGVDVATDDPLALGALHICDDPTGAQGAFAVNTSSKGGFRQVWKSLKRH